MTKAQLSTRQRSLVLAAALAALWLASPAVSQEKTGTPAPEQLPPGTKVVRLEAMPTAIALKNPYEYAQLVLTAQLSTGEKIDVTRLAKLAPTQPVLKRSERG